MMPQPASAQEITEVNRRRRSTISRATLGALALTMALVASACWREPALAYFGAPTAPSAFSLHQPLEYLLFAPILRLLDELSLLTDRQHEAVLISVTLATLVCAFARAWRSWSLSRGARARQFVRDVTTVATVTVLVYVGGAVLPRPMVSLSAVDPSDVLVDFHSHTDSSHDGRWGFDAESNRTWHAAAGFNAAYLTDHQTTKAWQVVAARGELRGRPRSVRKAASFTGHTSPTTAVILPGMETVVRGAHINLLGDGAANPTYFSTGPTLDTRAFASTSASKRPLVLLTLPFETTRGLGDAPKIDAIEISDGSPRGIGFARMNRRRLQAIADSLKIPVVASSNSHGWGGTAVAWTALRIDQWQAMSAQVLDEQIRDALTQRPSHVRVVERVGLSLPEGSTSVIMTVPRLLVHIARELNPVERAAFVGWIWTIWFFYTGRRRPVAESRRTARGRQPIEPLERMHA